MGLLEPTHLSALPAPSFNLKDMAQGLGSETRLDRSKGDTRSDTVLLDSSATLITNGGRLERSTGHCWEWGWGIPEQAGSGNPSLPPQITRRPRAVMCLLTTYWAM